MESGDREAGEESGCHPERSGLAAEPKDLPAEMTAALNEARRSFDLLAHYYMSSGAASPTLRLTRGGDGGTSGTPSPTEGAGKWYQL